MLHPTTFSLRQFCGIAFSPSILLGQLSKVVFQHFLFLAILRNCILKIFPLMQFYGIVFSKHFLWCNSTELYSQNISFKTTLRSRIIQKSLWGNSEELYSQNIFFKTTLQSCIPTLSFEAILRNCILKIFSLGKLYGVVFPHFPWGKSVELYSQNISFEATLRSCISTLPIEAILLNCILKTFPLRQLCGVVFSKHFLWGNSTKLYSQNLLFWGNFAELYHTFSLGQLCRVAFPQMFEDIISPCE